MSGLPYLDARRLADLVPMADAIEVLEVVLRGGFDAATDPARCAVPVAAGQLLLMPSQTSLAVGVKVVSVAPANPSRKLPRVQAVYVLMDPQTLSPIALLDGVALTSLRTPAVSAVAARHLAPADAHTLVVFGCGPQAAAHVESMRAVRDIRELLVIGRDPARTAVFAAAVGGKVGTVDDVGRADIVVCATSAADPLFTDDLVRSRTCVVAVGSHEPHVRELDAGLMHRAHVVVEDQATALREAGDVVQAALTAAELTSLGDVVMGQVRFTDDAPRVFKSVGMAWEDLAVATEAVRRAS
ncbi:MAG TPA: ornithine cyclodeaminase family protein [Ilumatobacteraceae bacterium]|nr:ornithine cyclodeaminase family protein [Ilumatobacteraceae bacterium]